MEHCTGLHDSGCCLYHNTWTWWTTWRYSCRPDQRLYQIVRSLSYITLIFLSVYLLFWILTWVLTLTLKRRDTKIFPSNYIAADLFHPKNLCEKFYSNYYHYREQSLVNSLLNFPMDHLLEVLVKWKEFVLFNQFSIFEFFLFICIHGESKI